MRTFSQVQNDVRTWIKEVSGDSGYWTNQEIKDAINETYHFIADQTMCFKLEEIIQVKANIRKYKLPENYVVGSLYRVEFNDKRIFPITSGELDALSSTWRSTTSETPTHFIPPGDICNTDEIILYPCPSVDGKEYNLASDSKDDGVIVSVGDDSFEEFESDEGVLVATSGEAHFDETEGTGPVLDIKDSENNVRIFGAKYPKRLFNDNEVFLHPLSNNPRSILTNGSLAILLSKDLWKVCLCFRDRNSQEYIG